LISLNQFSKCYESSSGVAIAVSELSMEVQPGQVLGLVGRNGAGKTSTLKSIAGILSISGGTIEVDGFDVVSSPVDAKQRTAYVPDDPELFHDLTVQQHLQFVASVYQIQSPGPRISELLADFELRQKLAICCAWLQAPKAMLLDEPMTGLDPYGIRMLKQSVTRQADSGVAVIISSHLLAMVEDICSDILILDEGCNKFYGTLEQLKLRFGDRVPSHGFAGTPRQILL